MGPPPAAALSAERLQSLAREHGTPLFVYDAELVRTRVRELRALFDVVRYAQKANSSRALLSLVRAEGCAVDAVSAGEIERALAAGFAPGDVLFTADLFDRAALAVLRERRVPVNLGTADMVEQYAALGVGREIVLRVNPGFGAGHSQRVTTGGAGSKHGIWHEELASVVARARVAGLEVVGLHVHIGSGADVERLCEGAAALRRLAPCVGRSLAVLSAGGGIPVPYRPGEPRADVARLAGAWRQAEAALETELDRPLTLEVEPGRYLVAEAGVLLTEVRATKRSGGLDFVLVDAGFHNLVRPALYGAYHAISAVGRAASEPCFPQVVAGPLCESADVFTQDAQGRPEPRALPRLGAGDLLCVHAAGAYGASMASNYNSQPMAAEVLVDRGVARLVRPRQSLSDLWGDERS